MDIRSIQVYVCQGSLVAFDSNYSEYSELVIDQAFHLHPANIYNICLPL